MKSIFFLRSGALLVGALALLNSCVDLGAIFGSKVAPEDRKLRALYLGKNSQPEADAEVTAIYRYLLAHKHSQEGDGEKGAQVFRKMIETGLKDPELLTAAAMEEASLSRLDEALHLLDEALLQNPEDTRALLAKARILTEKGDLSQSVMLFQKLLKANPDDEELVDALVQIHVGREDFMLAERILQKHLANNPDSEYALYRLGLLYRSSGNLETARQTLEKLIEVAPDSYQAAGQLARVYEEMGERKKALGLYEWLAKATNSSTYHWMLALLYTEMRRFDQAIEAFENLERTKVLDDQTKLMMLSVKAHQQRDLKTVSKELAKLSERNPDNDSIRMVLAEVYQMDNKLDEALSLLEKIKIGERNYLEALSVRLKILDGASKAAELKTVLDSHDPDQFLQSEKAEKKTKVFSEMAYYYSKIKDFAVAHRWLDKGLRSSPSSIQLLYMKGIVLEKQERMDEAVKTMEKIIELEPRNASALNFVGYSWADRGVKLAKAENYIRLALAEKPGDPYITDSLGWVLYKRGAYHEALEQLQKAFEALPKESIIASHLGDVYMRLGQVTEARRLYEKALELGPEKDSEKLDLENKLARLQDQPLHPQVAERKPGASAAAENAPKQDCLEPRDPTLAHSRTCFIELRDSTGP